MRKFKLIRFLLITSCLLAASLLTISSGLSFAETTSSVTGVDLGVDSSSISASRMYTLDQVSAKQAFEKIKVIRDEMWDENVPFNGKPLRQAASEKGLDTKEKYINAIKWNSVLERIAIQRALETAEHGEVAHKRVVNKSIFTAKYNGHGFNAECLAWGGDADFSVLELWGRDEKNALISANGNSNSQNGHLHILINPSLKYYAIGYLPELNKDYGANGKQLTHNRITSLSGAQSINVGNENSVGIDGEKIVQIGVPKNKAKDADYHNPDIVTESIYKGESIDLTNNVTNLPSGAIVEDTTEETIDVNTTGNYLGKIQITYPDGSKKTTYVDIVISEFEQFNVRVTDNIYARNGIWGTKYGSINKNTIKTVYNFIKDSNGVKWYKIWYDGHEAYIYSLYTSKNLTKVNNFNVRATSNLNVRDGVWGNKKGVIDKGTIKTVYGIRKDRDGRTWYRIWYNNKSHFIISDYTSKQLSYNIRVTDKIYYRSSPWGTKKGTLYKNRIKTVYKTKKDNNGTAWFKVYVDHQPYYIYSLCTSENLTKVNNFNTTLSSNVNVRDSVWGTKIGYLYKNTVKTVYGQRKDRDGNTWYRVWYNGDPAYIIKN